MPFRNMDTPIDMTPIEDRHPSEHELLSWISGNSSNDQKIAITEHLPHCDMCSDTVRGLLNFEDVRGLSQTASDSYSAFAKKHWKKQKNNIESQLWWANHQWLTIALALILIAISILSIWYFVVKPTTNSKTEKNTEYNRVDSLMLMNEYLQENTDTSLFQSSSLDSTKPMDLADSMNLLLLSINNQKHGITPSTDIDDIDNVYPIPQWSRNETYDDVESGFYTDSYIDPYSTRTTYTKKRNTNSNNSYNPTTSYNDYQSSSSDGSSAPFVDDNMTTVGNQMLNIDGIASHAKSLLNQGKTTDAIEFLRKYHDVAPESVPEIDFLLAQAYEKNNQNAMANILYKTLSSYPNVYQKEAIRKLSE